MARRALTIGTWFAAVAVAALLTVPAHAQTTQRDKAGKPGTIKRAQAAVAPAKAKQRPKAVAARPSMGQRAGLHHAAGRPLDLKSSVALLVDQDTK